MKKYKTPILFLISMVLFCSCKTVDIRTNYVMKNKDEKTIEKGKMLLQNAYKKMGYDNLREVETYKVNSNFTWKMPWTMMPMNALPGNKNKNILFKFNPNTFDGQVLF